MPGKTSLLVTLIHETGHSFDLAHSNKKAVMQPYYQPSMTEYTEDDINGFAHVWSPVKARFAPPGAAPLVVPLHEGCSPFKYIIKLLK